MIVVSKKGADLATVLYEVLQMKERDIPQISAEVVKQKLDSILGDGQFIKENGPFKNTLNQLVGKELIYRWDPLHLFNRAHISARGAIYTHEVQNIANDDYDWEWGEKIDTIEIDSQDIENITEKLRQLIKYIQKHAKQYRTGIKHTALSQYTHGQFKRPKVWSSTRMCLYEWDMLDRFLYNSRFF